MRNTFSLLAIALVATWGAINLGCAPSEAPTGASSGSATAGATTQVSFNVEGMT